MMFFQTPAETGTYMILGFAVIFGTLLIYLFSLFVRRKNLKDDMETLKELEESEE